MIKFEWYVKRARIDLGLFFKVENINSDEDLAVYCESKGLSLPEKEYFPEKTEVASAGKPKEADPQENKPKRTRRKPKEEIISEVPPISEVAKTKPKPARKTRRTTKKKDTSK